MKLTHASFFSGAGGLDMGLERAGWTTVSLSEIDAYASAVLASRWPDVPNLGCIHTAAGTLPDHGHDDKYRCIAPREPSPDGIGRAPRALVGAGGHVAPLGDAFLWSGGFPCQDLSNAGKRAGFTGHRSSLAFVFLDLVERYRPRTFLLENVPGLLSSNDGRDMARLLGEVVDLGYGVAWRMLDARYFGVPQRRRRVFILAVRSEADDPDGRAASLRAAEVLSVGTRCDRHPPTGGQARARAARGVAVGAGRALAGALTRRYGKGVNSTADDGGGMILDSSAPSRQEPTPAATTGRTPTPGTSSPSAVRRLTPVECERLMGWPDGWTIPAEWRGRRYAAPTGYAAPTFVKVSRPSGPDGIGERWAHEGTSPTLNGFDASGSRAVSLVGDTAPTVLGSSGGGNRTTDLNGAWVQALDTQRGGPDDNAAQAGHLLPDGLDSLLPDGLDSNRYRCIGNGVVAPVAEWLGNRIREGLA